MRHEVFNFLPSDQGIQFEIANTENEPVILTNGLSAVGNFGEKWAPKPAPCATLGGGKKEKKQGGLGFSMLSS